MPEIKIKLSKCCGAVMVNDNRCPCCDRYADPVEEKRLRKAVDDMIPPPRYRFLIEVEDGATGKMIINDGFNTVDTVSIIGELERIIEKLSCT